MTASDTHNPQRSKERVLDTALQLFTARGYFNTSLQDIRKASGVSIGSIYHHFQNKEHLAQALYHDLLDRFEASVRLITENYSDCRERCHAVMQDMFDSAEQQPEMMVFILYARHREFMPNERTICSAKPFELTRAFIEQGMECGEIRRMDTWVAASALFGGAVRIIQLHLDGALPKPLHTYFDETWEAGWRAVAV